MVNNAANKTLNFLEVQRQHRGCYLYSYSSFTQKILLYEAGVAHAVHLPPVGFKGLLLLCQGVQEVLNKVVERGAYV